MTNPSDVSETTRPAPSATEVKVAGVIGVLSSVMFATGFGALMTAIVQLYVAQGPADGNTVALGFCGVLGLVGALGLWVGAHAHR